MAKKMARKAQAQAAQEGGQKAQAKKESKPKAGKKAKAQEGTSLVGKIDQFKEFFSQSQDELKKVTWPSRKDTIATSIVVVVVVVVMSLFLSVVDLGLTKLIQAILS